MVILNFEKLLLEVNKRLPNSNTVQTSKIKNSTKELPRIISSMSFNKRFFCKGEETTAAYGVSVLKNDDELSEKEINESCETFKSVIYEVFNFDSDFKVNLVCSGKNFWKDEEGREYYGSTFFYSIVWFIFK